MKEIKVIDKESGEVLDTVEFSGGYNITYTNNHDSGDLRHIRNLDNGKFDKNCWIKNEIYRPIADKIVKKFHDEFRHINTKKILFIEDTEWKPGSQDRPWIARTSKANKHLQAMTGYDFIIESREWYTKEMTSEQIVALIYHEIKHIDWDGSLNKHDIEDWGCMVATLGADWATTRAEIKDILDEDFEEWDNLRKAGTQISIYENVRVMRASGQ